MPHNLLKLHLTKHFMSMDEIKTIAESIRAEFENGTIPLNLVKSLYQSYNPLENIDIFFDEARKLFPKGSCGIASVYLNAQIKGSRIIRGRYNEKKHTFLLVNNNIVDITADQYGGPKVYIGPIVSPWNLE